MIKIAFTNQKGGVGKSTSTINCSAILAQLGYKVLVVDLDPQGNATEGLGIDNGALDLSIYDCLINEIPLHRIIRSSSIVNVDVLPANSKLVNAEIEMSSMMGRELLLRDRFEESNFTYDFALFDLPPNLGLLSVNGLVAIDKIIIPVDVGAFSLTGISQLINLYKVIKKKLNPSIEIMGVLLTKVDCRTKLSKEMYQDLYDIFGSKVFTTAIHQNIKIVEAQKEQKPITLYASESKGASDYINLVKEMLAVGIKGQS